VSGTDKSKTNLSADEGASPKPSIVLVETQLGENIGAAARAMANFGLPRLRLVRPRDGWPSEKAQAAASGALDIIADVELFDDERAAVADCPRVYATTARPRELLKPVLTPEHAAREMRALAGDGIRSAILFGGERAGLTNDQISLADVIISAPVNPRFASLNLAQAVLLVAYEWFKAESDMPAEHTPLGRTGLASRDDVYHLFDHLEAELDRAGFFFPSDKTPHMVRNIRTVLLRAGLTDQEVRTWRGMIKALAEGPKRKRGE
jgi:tRNA/rRNA methyltransferase